MGNVDTRSQAIKLVYQTEVFDKPSVYFIPRVSPQDGCLLMFSLITVEFCVT